jgi:hypothetical protein
LLNTIGLRIWEKRQISGRRLLDQLQLPRNARRLTLECQLYEDRRYTLGGSVGRSGLPIQKCENRG